MPSRSS
ncbi:Protein of unknown function [Bacillus mycoides]|nr:Protein of unknown function [Bacillus mycoides]